MSAPKGNANARKGHHQRVMVPFSGKILDAVYASLGMYDHENEPEKIRETVQSLVHDALRNLDRACCFNGPKCHTGAQERPTSEMAWCEISKHYGWYCQVCYEVEHLPRDEARVTLAMYKEQQEEQRMEDEPVQEYCARCGDNPALDDADNLGGGNYCSCPCHETGIPLTKEQAEAMSGE